MTTQIKKIFLIASLILGATGSLRSEEAGSLQDIDQRLKVAERKLELAAEAADATKKADATVSAGSGGFTITSSDKAYSLKLGGLLQADSRTYLADDKAPVINDILVRRARLISQAGLGSRLKLNLVAELAGAAPSLVDAFADVKLHDWVSLRVGRFKTPISLENLRSDPARDFAEAGFSLGLTPVRDNGLWAEVADPDQAFSLGGGVFDGGLDGATVTGDTSDDKEAVAKIFFHPTRFFDTVTLRDFGFGATASSGHRVPGSATSSYRSTGQQTVSSYKALTTVQDQSLRIAPQAYLFQGPWSLLGEYVRSTDFATNTTNAAINQVAILARESWQVSAGWVITGEDAAFSGLKWNKETTAPWGVWQLVGRYQEFLIDSSNVYDQPVDGANVGAAGQRFVNPRSSATKIQGWGVGLNWIPLANAKIYLDFEQNLFTDGASQNAAGIYNGATPTKTINRETENTLFARAQFTY